MNRPAIERFQRIASLLAGGRHITAREIAEQLEITTKTVYRDIDFMRDRLGLPIETDGQARYGKITGGYYFSKSVQLCPVCLNLINP